MKYKQATIPKLLDLSVSGIATARHDTRREAEAASTRQGGLRQTLATWKLRHRTRRHLASADPAVLRDVGISEAQRDVEIGKPFWVA